MRAYGSRQPGAGPVWHAQAPDTWASRRYEARASIAAFAYRRRAGLARCHPVDYPKLVTRDQAIAEVERRRAADPGASWIANERDGDWVVVRIGVAPTKVTGTATKPPPVVPQGDPHSAIERAAWFAGAGG